MSARRAKSNHMVHHVIWRQSHPILLSCEKSEIDEIKWKWIHFLSITVTVIQSSKNGLIQWNCTTLSLSIKSNLKIRKKPLGFTSLCFCCWIFFQKYEILVLHALLNHFIGSFHNATSWENLFQKIKFYFKTMFSNSENSIFLE